MSQKFDSSIASHTIYSDHQHLHWDNSRKPAIEVSVGDTVAFKDIDALCGQITAKTTLAEYKKIDWNLVNPIAGPVYVDGANPGDVLKVRIIHMESADWAWTAIKPGFGLLAEDFPDPALYIWSIDKTFSEPAHFGTEAKVPLKPFCGTIGLAPKESGAFITRPPHTGGGNMDIRDITTGVDLYLPVQVPGALFSIGDPHCAQGDGEVCGTAMEAVMSVTVKFDISKDEHLKFPRFVTPGPVTRHLDKGGYEVTTGIGPDPLEAAKDAVRSMIDRLCKTRGIGPENAYMLCSVCADIRISEIVNKPNYVLSCYFPLIVFE